MHHGVDTGLDEPRGEQRFGDVPDGVGVAEFVRAHRAGEDDGHTMRGRFAMQQLPDASERVRAVQDDDRVRRCLPRFAEGAASFCVGDLR